jgi:uncharacterized membrane protein
MVAVFLASLVESVEALTIVVAAGISRGWRSALEGTAVGLVVLVVIIGALGPALVYLVPIDVLRAVVGVMLLIFGLQWLRKAVLRAVGLKAKHDEDVIFDKHVKALSTGGTGATARGRDPQAFVVAFKGTFLEGLEVAIIVLGLGGGAHDLGAASAAAGAAILLVIVVGFVVARHLSGVPENAMKTVVGLMLVSFGTFWGGEGLGIKWPGSDLAIPVLVGVYAVLTWLIVQLARPANRPLSGEARSAA